MHHALRPSHLRCGLALLVLPGTLALSFLSGGSLQEVSYHQTELSTNYAASLQEYDQPIRHSARAQLNASHRHAPTDFAINPSRVSSLCSAPGFQAPLIW